MNPLSSLIPPHKKNNLIRWLNSSKPSMSAAAHLTNPIHKFVQRTTKSAHSSYSHYFRYPTSSSSTSSTVSDDQTIDSSGTWEDTSLHGPTTTTIRSGTSMEPSSSSSSSSSSRHGPQIKQTVVMINCCPETLPLSSSTTTTSTSTSSTSRSATTTTTTATSSSIMPSSTSTSLPSRVVEVNSDPSSSHNSGPKEVAMRRRSERWIHEQRKSQQKNKVLMLLQLEQMTTEKHHIKDKWRRIRIQICTVIKERHERLQDDSPSSSQHFWKRFEEQQRQRRRSRLYPCRETKDNKNNSVTHYKEEHCILQDLADYYRRFDLCLEELHERNEIIDLEAFKQLVIREVEERAEALHRFRERLKVVHGQLMQKFIIDELILGGLYHSDDYHTMSPGGNIRKTKNNMKRLMVGRWSGRRSGNNHTTSLSGNDDEWIEVEDDDDDDENNNDNNIHRHHQEVNDKPNVEGDNNYNSNDKKDPRNAIAESPGDGSEWVVCDW